MSKELDKFIATVTTGDTVKQTMRAIDQSGSGTAFIVDNNRKFCGLVTDGDIRRAILKGIGIDETPIEQIMNKSPIIARGEWPAEELESFLQSSPVLAMLSEYTTMIIPVLDENDQVTDIVRVSKKRPEGVEKPIVEVERKPGEIKPVNKVLVIGGAGYLGSTLCRRLLEKGYLVRVLDNLMYGDEGVKDLYDNSKFELIEGDTRNLQVVMQCLRGMDAVIHLAAIVGDPASALNPQEAIEINYLSTKLIAEACKYYQINRFLFASTCSVYGATTTPDTRVGEESPLNPVSLYALMKLKSENGILELLDENFSPTILRMATLYGLSPRMRFDLIVNLLSAKATVNKEITIFGGKQWRPNLHVKDAAEAYIRCLEEPIDTLRGQTFNVGSNEQNYQIKEIGEIIHKVIPEAKVITSREDVDERNYNVAFDKIKAVLNYETGNIIEDTAAGIRDAIETKVIENYTDDRYSNYQYLREKENQFE